MKIVVAARCMNDERHIKRFLYGYSFVDAIVISDGGSTDNSINLLNANKKVQLYHFNQTEEKDGIRFNYDAPHMNFVLNKAKELEPDWLIFDDIDDVPNIHLRDYAQLLFQVIDERHEQINAFRLYMWGEDMYFPKMNNHFDPRYTSLWAWQPDKLNIHADENIHHGTLVGLHPQPYNVELPMCLLHYSWHPDTIEQKIARYKAMGIAFSHPFNMANAGTPVEVPEWAHV